PGALPPATAPFAPRPDDAQRLSRLVAMKRRATALLGFMAALFAVASVFERRYPWLGYVRATAEAALVGGLADWFAVTALFRRPLGLPIPHTAIIATQKERIGRILGNFVQSHFLSRDVIAARLRELQPAARAARWLSQPENSRRIAQQVAAGLAKTLETLPSADMQRLLHEGITNRLRATRVGPALGKLLALVVDGNRHHELLSGAMRLAAEAVRDNWNLIRQQIRAESPWWVPPVIDDTIAQRIARGVERVLLDAAANPHHALRGAFDTVLRDFFERLQHSPEAIARAEALKEEWLSDPATAELSARLWEAARQGIVRYATQVEEDTGAGGALERGIAAFGAALASNQHFLEEIDQVLIDLAVNVVERNRQAVAELITQTVAAWEPEATAARVELAVGRDLQFVRINGTLVGGLVGLALYAIIRLRP
ncbi:MAG: DUF445 domain-containing protein, partial [Gemmatimonadetes bacterium]|nr:DUF445 domain-containing protein [Gemmatimonadota bacterium]